MTSRSGWDPNFDGVIGATSGDITVPGDYDSIQAAIDAEGSGTTIVVGAQYDETNETFPIDVDHAGITIRGGQGGPGATATIRNTTGSNTFYINPANERNPGVALLDMNIVQTAGGSAVYVEGMKFGYFENVHADGNNNGSDDLWYFGDEDDFFPNNSQVLVQCSAEQAGRYGFQFGNICHHVLMSGCTALQCDDVGVYVNGPYSFKFLGGQLEDCAGPGLRARVADSVLVGGGTYLEGNATGASPVADAEIAFDRTPNCWAEGPIWANGNGASYVVEFKSSTLHEGGRVSGVQTGGGYTAVANINGMDNVDVMAPSHVRSGAGVCDVTADSGLIRSNGVIVGAGSNNGGNDGLNGVDLGSVAGGVNRDRAISDGTTSGTDGLTAVWLAASSVWQPSDGGSTI